MRPSRCECAGCSVTKLWPRPKRAEIELEKKNVKEPLAVLKVNQRKAYTIGDSSVQHTDAANAGVECNADAAELVVGLSGHLTGASSSVSNGFN